MRTGNFSELLNPALSGRCVTTPARSIRTQASSIRRPSPSFVRKPRTTDLSPCGQPPGPPATWCDAGPGCAEAAEPLSARRTWAYPGRPSTTTTSQTNTVDNTFQWDTRMDWNISSKDQIFGRFSYNHEPSTHPAPLGPILDGGGFRQTPVSLFRWVRTSPARRPTSSPPASRTSSASVTTTATTPVSMRTPTTAHPCASSLGLGGVTTAQNNSGLPFFAVAGLSNFGSPQFYATNEYENVYQILDNVTKVVGNHSHQGRRGASSASGSPPRSRRRRAEPTPSPGSYTGRQGLAEHRLRSRRPADEQHEQRGDLERVHVGRRALQPRRVPVQDDWKASQRLTVNYGMDATTTRRRTWSVTTTRRPLCPRARLSAGSSTGRVSASLASKQGDRDFRSPLHVSLALDEDFTSGSSTSTTATWCSHRRPTLHRVQVLPTRCHGEGGCPRRLRHLLRRAGERRILPESSARTFRSSSTRTSTASSCTARRCLRQQRVHAGGRAFRTTIASRTSELDLTAQRCAAARAKVRTPYSEQFNLTVEYGISNSLVGARRVCGCGIAAPAVRSPIPNGAVGLAPSAFGSGYVNSSGRQGTNPLPALPSLRRLLLYRL